MAMSYKAFMDAVRKRLAALDHEQLRDLILSWAEQAPSAKRQEFLNQFDLTEEGNESESSTETLLVELEAFASRVEDGHYCEGWGWDHEIGDERDWGDESWAQEMDEWFRRSRGLLSNGDFKLAGQIYARQFDILGMGQEAGHLPGNPDYSLMLESELEEQVALYLRCVYLESAPDERAERVFEEMDEYGYLGTGMNLQRIVNASDHDLPEFDTFLAAWIVFLTESDGEQGGELLREAVRMQGGTAALAVFARQNADRYPKAYADWIEALEKEGDDKAVVGAAREGLAAIQPDYTARATVASALVRAGERRNDPDMKLEGCFERFYSDPSIHAVVEMYLAASAGGKWETMRDRAERRMQELQDRGSGPAGSYSGSERQTAFVSKGLVHHILLLGGRYEQVFDKCRGKGSLGWSSSEHPKPALLTFMLAQLTKQVHNNKEIVRQWETAIGYAASFRPDKALIEKYKEAAGHTWEAVPLSAEQEKKYLQWCMDEVGQRVEAIIGNKHRGSYDKAAGLIVAVAEGLAIRGREQEGVRFVDKFRLQYPRHSAFKSELTAALLRSDYCRAAKRK